MNVNAAIIDQRLNQVTAELREKLVAELNLNDAARQKNISFVYLCVKTLLDLENDEVFDTLTDGGNDFGVDALHISEEIDGEFVVTLFQAKYKNDLAGTSNFPEDGVEAAAGAVRYLFDPSAHIVANPRLLPKIEEVRSRISDGYIPQVRVILCNNGAAWNEVAQGHIDRLGAGDQVTWEHVNHDRLLSIMQSTKPVNDTLRLNGKAIVEDFDFSRILVGKVSVSEIAALIDRHGDKLLERNIRRYLGLSGNRVNEGIRGTLMNQEERQNFYFYNNGITLTCTKFDYNALQQSDFQVKIENLQVINGGQTSNTIARVIKEISETDTKNLDKAFVMIRLYQLSQEKENFVQNITYATNSQNPVDLKDLKANDEVQLRLERDVSQLGYTYRRKRTDSISSKPEEISSATAAEAILAVWRKRPHQAKFFAREHFGKLYNEIFSPSLTGAQLVTATLLYRIAENKRKRPDDNAPEFIAYASCFLAMRMGEYLVRDINLKNDNLDHRQFESARELISKNGERYFYAAQSDISDALKALYGDSNPTLQRLSATFRRGDLIEELAKLELRPLQ